MMTPGEILAVQALAEAWNAMVECGAADQEAAAHIHALQHAVMARTTARLHPDIFRQPPQIPSNDRVAPWEPNL